MCSAAGANRYAPNQTDIDFATIIENELLGVLHWNSKKAEVFLKKAVTLEEKASYAYGPPKIIQPSFELFGKWLLENNRPQEALTYYQKALERGPNRLRALIGMQKSSEALNQKEGFEKYTAELVKLLKDADPGVKSMILGKEETTKIML